MVTISIVTPTRNAAEYLVETIESVRSQSTDEIPIEHIFVDSGSTDGTLDILEAHGCQVIHVPPVNVNYSTNVGMRAATGGAIGFLGGDDLLMPGAPSIVASWIANRTRPWMVGAIHWTDPDSRSIGILRPPPTWMSPEMYASLGWSCVPAQTVWFTPEFFAELGGFSEEFEHIGDYDCFARALTLSPFDRFTQTLATFRRHGKNMSMTAGDARLGELARIQAEFAPSSRTKREAQRLLMKIRVNAGNPAWMLHKKIPFLPRRPVP
ncbi:MAG TPA: glycosyltransferase [Acidimicrobiia bacterium]|nr:glycosyltransferase [Acidimicrobiia bacterium]